MKNEGTVILPCMTSTLHLSVFGDPTCSIKTPASIDIWVNVYYTGRI